MSLEISKARISGREFQKRIASDERIWRVQMKKYFLKMRKEMLEVVNDSQLYELSFRLPEIVDRSNLSAIYENLYTNLFYKYYRAVLRGLTRKSSYDFGIYKAIPADSEWWAIVEQYLTTQAATKITGINNVTKGTVIEIVQTVIQDGIEKGLSIDQIVVNLDANIDSTMLNMSKVRARLIARTETIAGSNFASLKGAEISGLEVTKAWLSAKQPTRTRADHYVMDSSDFIPIDSPFNVGGYDMMHPGDGSMGAPAKEICNCRCTLIYRSE